MAALPDIASASVAAKPAHVVRRLTLTDFRCYAHLRLEADGRPVVLTGPNGAGKTNVLEALSYLAPGRGLRGARLGEVARRTGNRGWAVAALIDGAPAGLREIGTGTVAGAADEDSAAERRQVRIDGESARGPAALAESFSIAWITPQMDRLFQEDASSRRRFLDRLVYGVDTAHAARVSAYERAMRERARLLKTGSGNDGWLSALEETMAGHGVAVAAARRDAVARLAGRLERAIGPFPAAALSADGTLEGWLEGMAAVDVEQAFCEALAGSRTRDAETGGAGVGPHRSDLGVRHLGKDLPARQCSTGEQKALLVSIVLADAELGAARRGVAPVLLLDEIAAHLDAMRRDALYEQVLDLGVQAWLTGTDRALFAALKSDALFLEVEDGRIAGIQNG